MTTASTGRNERCPCGSGKKYKACCALKSAAPPEVKRSAPWRMIGLGLAGVVVAGGVALQLMGSSADPRATPSDAPVAPATPNVSIQQSAPQPLALDGTVPAAGSLTPQPPGPAPDGKVWSPEHGHWHDAPGAAAPVSVAPGAVSTTITPDPPQPGPQPPGPAPEGKVWSEEHGHWHDAPRAGEADATPGGTPPH